MRAPKEILGSLFRRVRGQNAVYVRETNFGYVIRSERNADLADKRGVLSRFVLAGFVLCACAVWLLLGGVGSVLVTALISALLVLTGLVSMTLIRGETGGIELHVDVNRRELRSAVVTARGESWIRSSARFGDVSELYLRRSDPGSAVRSLCLRVKGEEDVMPIAVGHERSLLTIHDRLSRDLQAERDAANPDAQMHAFSPRAATSKTRHVFPRLGPDEQRL